ncbi:MAG: radical SAM protein [Thermoplasmata archaeon]|nr:MAG: radical SAM protein [Thermoplasmata archaeon]
MMYEEIRARVALVRSGLSGVDYALNPYVGCEHDCVYCYGPYVTKRDRKNWGRIVRVKRNLPYILSKEIKRVRGIITIGTVTDAYQPAERKYEITRMCLRVLHRANVGIRILTKSSLISRDIDMLEKFQDIHIGVTITTLNPEVSKVIEPNSSLPAERLKALIDMPKNIVRYLFVGPIIPEVFSVDDVIEAVQRLGGSGLDYIIFDKLRVRGDIYERLSLILRDVGLSLPDISGLNRYYRNIKANILKALSDYNIPIFFEF